MQVDRQLVGYLADLACLELSDDEISWYEQSLGKIVGYMEQLSQVEDDLGDDWRADTIGAPTPERPDQVRPSLDPERTLEQAPMRSGTAFRVPRIIE